MNDGVHTFGPYVITVQGTRAMIVRSDGEPAQPTFYELMHLKCLAWGSHARAVEIFPAQEDLLDSRNKRWLWNVPDSVVLPCLRAGRDTWHV